MANAYKPSCVEADTGAFQVRVQPWLSMGLLQNRMGNTGATSVVERFLSTRGPGLMSSVKKQRYSVL